MKQTALAMFYYQELKLLDPAELSRDAGVMFDDDVWQSDQNKLRERGVRVLLSELSLFACQLIVSVAVLCSLLFPGNLISAIFWFVAKVMRCKFVAKIRVVKLCKRRTYDVSWLNEMKVVSETMTSSSPLDIMMMIWWYHYHSLDNHCCIIRSDRLISVEKPSPSINIITECRTLSADWRLTAYLLAAAGSHWCCVATE